VSRVRMRTLALEDQILAILRDADGFPTSTAELREAIGPTCEHRWRKPGHCQGCSCPDREEVTFGYWELHPILKRMERRGTITALRVEGSRRIYWLAQKACSAP